MTKRPPAQSQDTVAVIGAGVGGLVAAIGLALRGFRVVVLESAARPGGKLREVTVAGRPVDAGPTVFTLRAVFEEIFAEAGAALGDELGLRPAALLARHHWRAGETLDLYADPARSADAVGDFAGAAEARRFRDFLAAAARIHRTLEHSFLRAPRPGVLGLSRAIGFGRVGELLALRPFMTLWRALEDHFVDPRLRQLYGRYATYCGSSPFAAPATLMLIAHVESTGVWLVDGGMHALARALAALATRLGVEIHCGRRVASLGIAGGRVAAVHDAYGERLACDAVVFNGDAAALADGLLGPDVTRAASPRPLSRRSLSAVTWCMVAPTAGTPLVHHNVFFSPDYRAEFRRILGERRLPEAPTVYVCAQDRDDAGECRSPGAERLLCLVNAPAIGDRHSFGDAEIDACERATFAQLQRTGLSVSRTPEWTRVTTPADFERLFPGTGGALYGPATHGWRASFTRPGSRTAIPGLYLAGGSSHPGAGLPMAALSGRLAAAAVTADRASISRSRTVAMRGGTSTA